MFGKIGNLLFVVGNLKTAIHKKDAIRIVLAGEDQIVWVTFENEKEAEKAFEQLEEDLSIGK